jgi:hypothetical protein
METKDLPFTMETYKEIKPGTKVYVELPSTRKLYGITGNLWGAGDPIPVIRFNDGGMIQVNDKMVHMVHLEPLN